MSSAWESLLYVASEQHSCLSKNPFSTSQHFWFTSSQRIISSIPTGTGVPSAIVSRAFVMAANSTELSASPPPTTSWMSMKSLLFRLKSARHSATSAAVGHGSTVGDFDGDHDGDDGVPDGDDDGDADGDDDGVNVTT